MTLSLKNKVAIVTGGSEGIGYAISQQLAREGVKVYLVARTQEKLERAQREIHAQGIFAADIRHLESIKDIITTVEKNEGTLDIFVNNAGVYESMPLEGDFSAVERLVDINMLAPLRIAHYLAQRWTQKKEQLSIVNIASQAGLQVFPQGLAYGTAKMGFVAGLLHLEKELQERKNNNVRLYTLYPGTVLTEKVKPLVAAGVLQNPTSLESVVAVALDMLKGNISYRHVRIGYFPGVGIKRIYLEGNPKDFSLLQEQGEETVDRVFKP